MTSDDPPGRVLLFGRPRRVRADVDRLLKALDDEDVSFEESDIDEGLACAEAAIARGIDGGHALKVRLLNIRAHRALAAGDDEGALAKWTAILAAYPDFVPAYLMRARIHTKRGDNEAALANLRRAAQLDPTSEEALLGLAHGLEVAGDAAGARKAYARAAEVPLDDAESLKLRGFMSFVSGRGDLALADYEAAVALSPGDADALGWRGLCRLRLGRLEGAISDFTRVIALEPANALAYRRRGEAHVGMGDCQAAHLDRVRAFEIRPDDPRICADYGRSVAMSASTDEERAAGHRHIIRSAELDPGNAAGWARAACYLRSSLAADQGVAAATRAIELDPGNPAYLRERSICLVCSAPARWIDPEGFRSRAVAALADVDRAIALSKTEDVDLLLARIRLREDLGDLAGALADAERIVQIEPNLEDGHAARARLLEQIAPAARP